MVMCVCVCVTVIMVTKNKLCQKCTEFGFIVNKTVKMQAVCYYNQGT